MGEVVDHSDDAQYRCGIDVALKRFVVEADVAAGDRRFEGRAGFGHAVDDFAELPHHFGMFGIAEVEAVCRRQRPSAGADDIAARFSDHQLGAFARILRHAESRTVERHRRAPSSCLSRESRRRPSRGRPSCSIAPCGRIAARPIDGCTDWAATPRVSEVHSQGVLPSRNFWIVASSLPSRKAYRSIGEIGMLAGG